MDYTKEEKELIKIYRKGKLPLSTFITSHLFNGITEEDLWREKINGVMVDGNLIKKEDFRMVSKEAENFIDGALWRQTKKYLQLSANNRMFNKATTAEELIFGKAMLYNLSLVEEFLKKISKIQ
jgi:hypothetical protein